MTGQQETTEPKIRADVAGQNERLVRNTNIGCDQVAWLLDICDRYLPPSKHPRISREREMKKYAMLYEIMEIAGLRFEDERARWNGTPNDARPYA